MTTTAHTAKEIRDHLESEEGPMKEFLRELVSMESPSRDLNALEKIMHFLESVFSKLGYYTLRVPGKETGGYLYARPKNREKHAPIQLLVGHCDTVWELDSLKKMPVHEENEKFMGPGIYDMKAGLTQIYFALQCIRDLGLAHKVMPAVLINADEEIGSLESTAAIARLAAIANRAFILEPPLGLQGKLKTGRKGIGKFTVKVQGRAAHAGLDPEKGINAIVELSKQVQKLYAMNDPEKGITINVGKIEGGTSANVVASESSAVVDVRVYNQEDADYISRKILSLKPSHKEVVMKIEGGIRRIPMEKTERNRVLWDRAKAGGELLDLKLEEATAGGGSDGNTTSLYTATLDGLGTTGDGAHAQHEFIFTKQLPERTALLTLLLLEEPLT
ncbi:M20 family metallopeptidase [Salinimicrobium sediminilitoris]|uniref:M20 family metallopeptidase n=1 Tax=Salinimicrobium sediminilitoris TaxID=2876715 RepID=UPI001E4B0542|nr:M20 family metallopeptidase [Salinimicrobium sediminilitoris]MCC8359000.1 M20 family metallopeptidase [Salinimicrobium sediminilitoris]